MNLAFTCGFLAGLPFGAFAFSIALMMIRDLRARRAYQLAVEEMRRDPEIRRMAADVRRRAQTRRLGLRVVAGGRERGPFGGRNVA